MVDPLSANNTGFAGVVAHDAATALGPVVAQDPGHVALQTDGINKLGAVVAHDPATPPGKMVAPDCTNDLFAGAGRHNGIGYALGPNNMGFVSAPPPEPAT